MPRLSLRSALRADALAGAAAIAVILSMPAPAAGQGAAAAPDFTAMVRQTMPAVVAITTRQRVQEPEASPPPSEDMSLQEFLRRFFEERLDPRSQQPRQSLGSGFVISPEGYIVTNDHVIGNAEEIEVVFGGRKRVPASLVGRDPATDIAVLKVDPPAGMSVATWGDSDAAEPGSWAIAIGSPFGLGGTVTVGVISAQSRDIRSGLYSDFLQTDASINRGNSGGPLFNAKGEVIGVNTAIYSPSGGNVGIGFAVPSRNAQTIAEQLIRAGRVERGHIGVRLQELTPAIAQALGRPDEKGVLIASVDPGGPAEKAGIRLGDVVIGFNGNPVESGRDLSRAIAAAKPGTQVSVAVHRDGRSQDLSLTIGPRPDASAGQGSPEPPGRRMGLALGPLPEAARDRLGLEPGGSGLLVQQVEPGSPAAETGLRPGDVILSANNRPVSQPADVANAWTAAQRQNRPVLLRVSRDGQPLFVAVGV
ncbi:Do family serine endopeptidase [Microvirga rosea]|uniref:Do family serine endopeptidase n=1 Tax=Microvirga rosea TaxID=2715425 RepID=UPI001D0A2969|nr:Do family serine endopeptidase [Microvirga rosea]MCB8823166.1 Do family serine endopeptidase [Microvirga rosea]